MGRQVAKQSAGDYRLQFQIYETQELEDGQGDTSRLPVLVDTVWGSVVTLSPFRQMASAQVQQRVTHRVEFRCGDRIVKVNDELRYRDHRLVTHRMSVKIVVDVNVRAKLMVVEAEEVVEVNANNPELA